MGVRDGGVTWRMMPGACNLLPPWGVKRYGATLYGDIWCHFSCSKLVIVTKCNCKPIFGAGRFVFNHIPECHKYSAIWHKVSSIEALGMRLHVDWLIQKWLYNIIFCLNPVWKEKPQTFWDGVSLLSNKPHIYNYVHAFKWSVNSLNIGTKPARASCAISQKIRPRKISARLSNDIFVEHPLF